MLCEGTNYSKLYTKLSMNNLWVCSRASSPHYEQVRFMIFQRNNEEHIIGIGDGQESSNNSHQIESKNPNSGIKLHKHLKSNIAEVLKIVKK